MILVRVRVFYVTYGFVLLLVPMIRPREDGLKRERERDKSYLSRFYETVFNVKNRDGFFFFFLIHSIDLKLWNKQQFYRVKNGYLHFPFLR